MNRGGGRWGRRGEEEVELVGCHRKAACGYIDTCTLTNVCCWWQRSCYHMFASPHLLELPGGGGEGEGRECGEKGGGCNLLFSVCNTHTNAHPLTQIYTLAQTHRECGLQGAELRREREREKGKGWGICLTEGDIHTHKGECVI